MPYCSSLTDSEWETIEPILHHILPRKKRTRPCNWTKREILDGIYASTKKWLQLARPTQGLATLTRAVYCLYLLLKSTGSDRRADEAIT
jgi:hypothetical protein